jgi:hypothetical protein
MWTLLQPGPKSHHFLSFWRLASQDRKGATAGLPRRLNSLLVWPSVSYTPICGGFRCRIKHYLFEVISGPEQIKVRILGGGLHVAPSLSGPSASSTK